MDKSSTAVNTAISLLTSTAVNEIIYVGSADLFMLPFM